MAERLTTEITKRVRRRLKKSYVLSQMEVLLLADPYKTDFEKVAAQVQCLNQSKRRRLLSLCERAFDESDLRKDENTRVAAAKVMVALVPDSARAIRHWINTRSGKYIYEVHFSLFCFLDDVPRLPSGGAFATEIPSLIEQYLLDVKSKAARAAWMAGDLLGDHWQVTEALPVLMKVAKGARFVVGRDAAVDGLERLLHNLPNSDPARKSIIALLQDVYKGDRSQEVRTSARVSLEQGRKLFMTGKKN